MHRRLLILGLAFLEMLLLGGCSAISGPGSSGSGSGGLDLAGRTFISTGVTVGGAARPLVGGTAIRLSFTADRLTASAGCNTFGASYRLSADALRIDQGAATEMGCEPPRMDQDTWFFGLLGSGPTIAAPDADHLTLTAGGTIITLLDRRIAQPDLPLTGRTWTLTGLVSGQTASSVPVGVTAHIEFQADGSVAFDSGCNGGGGRYMLRSSATSSAGTFTLTGILSTMMACRAPQGSVEAAFRAVVREGVTIRYEITGSALRLSVGDQGLDFQA